jgi:tRNA(Ile2) C34 agmatinyltransferase TiaS
MSQQVHVVTVPAGEKGPVCGRCGEPLKGKGIVRTLGIIGMTCDPCCREIRREVTEMYERAIAEGRHTAPPAVPQRPAKQ